MVNRKRSGNIIHTLRDRESGFTVRHDNVHFSALPILSYERRFYESIMPSLTVLNVHTPFFFMRKFTPNGKMLLAISSDQRSLIAWSYQGVGSAANILKDEVRECITSADNDSKSMEIRKSLFNCLFRKKFLVRLAFNEYSRYHVHREFSIFFDDGRYVMVVASGFSDTAPDLRYYWHYPDIYDNLELYTYVFFVIDLQNGVVTSVLKFPHDNINLSHNHGVAAHGGTIAILSKFRQSIVLFEHEEGKLRELDMKGAFTNIFEELTEEISVDSIPPMAIIKQRILSFMVRQITEAKCERTRRLRLKMLYKNYPKYEKMLIEKIQLIDHDHVLIRFEEKAPDQYLPASSSTFSGKEFKAYVFYSFSMDKIIFVCGRHSTNLMYMLRDYCDQFRNVRSMFTGYAPSSPCNSEPFRNSFNKAISSFAGGAKEAASRFNLTVPVSTQSYATSPYLSYSLFAYDDRLISALERPKVSSNVPIRFCDRDTHETKFRLHLEQKSNTTTRELVAFIFHPYEPFLISIQKLQNGYYVNFHIYNRTTIVKE